MELSVVNVTASVLRRCSDCQLTAITLRWLPLIRVRNQRDGIIAS